MNADIAVSRIAAAIGEPARTRMLYSLMDGHARTSTELAMVAEVSPSTASVHLNRLKAEHLIRVVVQGRLRYYSLEGALVASTLEGLSTLANGLAGGPAASHRDKFVPNTPGPLCNARTCYDHMAGTAGVALHDRMMGLEWLREDYELTQAGTTALEDLGIDVETTRTLRRRFAFACLDWSERRPHLGGSLGAAILRVALKRKWVIGEQEGRVLQVSNLGRREVLKRFGILRWGGGD